LVTPEDLTSHVVEVDPARSVNELLTGRFDHEIGGANIMEKVPNIHQKILEGHSGKSRIYKRLPYQGSQGCRARWTTSPEAVPKRRTCEPAGRKPAQPCIFPASHGISTAQSAGMLPA
jgi:hypothetical protein